MPGPFPSDGDKVYLEPKAVRPSDTVPVNFKVPARLRRSLGELEN